MGLDKIAIYKKKLNMTTDDLSKLSGVPVGTLNKILSGATRDPKLETLKAIAKVLGLSLNDFDDDNRIAAAAAAPGIPGDCQELVDIYTELDPPDKSSVLGYARGVYAGEKYKKGNGALLNERRVS